MSHHTVWHLVESVPIKDIVAFEAWIEELREQDEKSDAEWHGLGGMVPLIQFSEYDHTVKDTETERVVRKEWSFDGLYRARPADKPDDLYYSNGYYGINHFCLVPRHSDHADRDVKFLAKLSTFLDGEVAFFVFDEGWPTLESGYMMYVTALDGDVAAVPMHLQRDE